MLKRRKTTTPRFVLAPATSTATGENLLLKVMAVAAAVITMEEAALSNTLQRRDKTTGGKGATTQAALSEKSPTATRHQPDGR